MKFRTELKITDEKRELISHKDKIMSIGSCFASNVQRYLTDRDFTLAANSFGILFNPVSIAKRIRNAINNTIDKNLFVERDGLWYHYDYHSITVGDSKAELVQFIEANQKEFAQELATTSRLIITLGTAWVYRLISADEIVANCHKIPQKEFKKERLDLEELKTTYIALFNDLKQRNPNLEIIVTVSPVRHIKNGLHQNNISKSILLLLTDFLDQNFEYVHYFPAYELVMDDLRDYRFYKADLIHPNEQAVDYVFDYFQEIYFSDKTKEIADLAKKHSLLIAHKPMHPTANQIAMQRKKEQELATKIQTLKSQT